MKLKNKKTGEIGEVNYYDNCIQVVDTNSPLCGNSILGDYRSLAELCEEWDDYEEPETYYYISDCVNIESRTNDHGYNQPEEIWHKAIKRRKEVGNYFSSKEEAELAVRKLQAWKRLKDKGFKTRFYLHNPFLKNNIIEFSIDGNPEEYYEELQTLFGGEE